MQTDGQITFALLVLLLFRLRPEQDYVDSIACPITVGLYSASRNQQTAKALRHDLPCLQMTAKAIKSRLRHCANSAL